MSAILFRKLRTFRSIIKSRLLTKYFENSNFFFQKYLRRYGYQIQISIAKKGNECYTPEFLELVENNWAIVFHGKIYDRNCLDFLKTSIEEIRSKSSFVEIVVSTYIDDFFEELRTISKYLHFTLIPTGDIGKMPSPYPVSIAQQIHSFATGLGALSNANLEKCMKVRVDQRVDIFRTIAFITSFEQNTAQAIERERLWGSSYNSYEKRPLGISDMFMAGSIENMKLYWRDTDVAQCIDSYLHLQEKYDDPVWGRFLIPETFLAARFLDSLGIELKRVDECNYIFWNRYTGVMNASHIEQKWFKTHDWLSSNYHSIKWFTSLWTPDFAELTFEKWFLTYGSNHINQKPPELKAI
jgi:hypothetical protein